MIFTIQTTEMSLGTQKIDVNLYESYSCRLADYISQVSVVVTFYTSVFQSPIPGKFLLVRKFLLSKVLSF
jgi:hypothetical protein